MTSKPYINPGFILERMGADPRLFHAAMREHFPYPRVINIESTNHCNLRCIMCNRHENRPKGFMAFDLFKRIIDECVPFEPRIWLNLAGEPLLHPRIADFVSYAKRSGIPEVCMNTNATLLSDGPAEALLDAGLDTLAVSIDSLHTSVFESIRRGARFETVQENTLRFAALRAELGLQKPQLDISFVVMPLNREERPAFREHWLKRLATGDSVSFAQWNTRVRPDPDLRRPPDSRDPRYPCLQLWRNSAVAWNGDVFSCYGDFEGVTRVGSLEETSLYELWHGSRLMEMRSRHLQGRFDGLVPCEECLEWDSEKQGRYQRFYKD